MMFLLLGGLGGWEIAVIIFAILLLFGGKKIPELMRGLGKGIREFNNARSNIQEELEKGIQEDKKQEQKASKALEKE